MKEYKRVTSISKDAFSSSIPFKEIDFNEFLEDIHIPEDIFVNDDALNIRMSETLYQNLEGKGMVHDMVWGTSPITLYGQTPTPDPHEDSTYDATLISDGDYSGKYTIGNGLVLDLESDNTFTIIASIVEDSYDEASIPKMARLPDGTVYPITKITGLENNSKVPYPEVRFENDVDTIEMDPSVFQNASRTIIRVSSKLYNELIQPGHLGLFGSSYVVLLDYVIKYNEVTYDGYCLVSKIDFNGGVVSRCDQPRDISSLPVMENISDVFHIGQGWGSSVHIAYIGGGVFKDYTKLNIHDLSQSEMGDIQAEAFYGCESLTLEGGLPKNLTNIGSRAFYNCYSLEIPSFPSRLTSIGSNAFDSLNDKTKKHTISLPSTIKSINIGENAFRNCSSWTIVMTTAQMEMLGDRIQDGKIDDATVSLDGDNNVIVIENGNDEYGNHYQAVGSDGLRVTLGMNFKYFTSKTLFQMDGTTRKLTHIQQGADDEFSYLPDTVKEFEFESFKEHVHLKLKKVPADMETFGTSCFQNGSLKYLESMNTTSGTIKFVSSCFEGIQDMNGVITDGSKLTSITFSGNPFGYTGSPNGWTWILNKDVIASIQSNIQGDLLFNSVKVQVAQEHPLSTSSHVFLIRVGYDGFAEDITYHVQYVVNTKKKTATILSIPKTLGRYPLMTNSILQDDENGRYYTIVGVAKEAAKNCTRLQIPHLPDTVSFIGTSAFENCKQLGLQELPSKVHTIRKDAFKNAFSTEQTFTIQQPIQQLDSEAFSGDAQIHLVIPKDSLGKLPPEMNDSTHNNVHYHFMEDGEEQTWIDVTEDGYTIDRSESFQLYPTSQKALVNRSVVSVSAGELITKVRVLSTKDIIWNDDGTYTTPGVRAEDIFYDIVRIHYLELEEDGWDTDHRMHFQLYDSLEELPYSDLPTISISEGEGVAILTDMDWDQKLDMVLDLDENTYIRRNDKIYSIIGLGIPVIQIAENEWNVPSYSLPPTWSLKGIPRTVQWIGYRFFQNSTWKEITLPEDHLMSVYTQAFQRSNIQISNLSRITFGIFFGIEQMEQATLTDQSEITVTFDMEERNYSMNCVSPFSNLSNSSLKHIHLHTIKDGSRLGWKMVEGLFQENQHIETITLSSITHIPKNAFKNCFALEEVHGWENEPYLDIGESAFQHCYNAKVYLSQSTINTLQLVNRIQKRGEEWFLDDARIIEYDDEVTIQNLSDLPFSYELEADGTELVIDLIGDRT